MSPFVTYLLAANVVAFLAYTVDFFLCGLFPKLDDSKANAIAMCLFPIAGGAVGTLLALFVCCGRLPGHRINKDNVAWWFLAFACLIVWGAITIAATGLMPVSLNGLLASWNLTALKALGIYLAVINLVTLVVFITDKAEPQTATTPESACPKHVFWGSVWRAAPSVASSACIPQGTRHRSGTSSTGCRCSWCWMWASWSSPTAQD